MTNKENFLQLVDEKQATTLEKARQRQRNRAMLRASQKIASKILTRLNELQWSQKQLAEKMEVSPQYVKKILRGKENLTLDTLIRLQEILNIALLASFSKDIAS